MGEETRGFGDCECLDVVVECVEGVVVDLGCFVPC